MTVKIVIAGGREFNDPAYLEHCMRGVYHLHSHKGIEIITGACRGADQLGEDWARNLGLPVDSRPPDYENIFPAKRAPLVRNEEMAAMAQVVCAFWDGQSTGTKHMIACAFRNNLEVHVFPYGEKP